MDAQMEDVRGDAGIDAGNKHATAEAGTDAAMHDAGYPRLIVCDTDAGDDDSDGGCETWAPNALSGLVLWLDAERGVTTDGNGARTITRWKDQSAHGNDAVQTRPEGKPTWVPNAVNGLPAVRFDGVRNHLLVADPDDDSLSFITDDLLLYVVGEWTNGVVQTTETWGWALLLSKQPGGLGVDLLANVDMTGNGDINARLGLQVSGYIVASDTDHLNDGRFRLYGGRRFNGATLETRINGAVVASGTIPASLSSDARGGPLVIGGSPIPAALDSVNGAIAEIVIVRDFVSKGDLAKLERYFKNKYRLWR